MDTVSQYRASIKKVFQDLLDYIPSEEGIRHEVILDDEHGHYQLMRIGWHHGRRVHGTLLHIDLISDKVYVEHDGTDLELVTDLINAGIPEKDIVLGFHPPEHRKYTEFAVA